MKPSRSHAAAFLAAFLIILNCTGVKAIEVGTGSEPVKIGLLVNDKGSFSAINGARLAIDMANRSGGYKGRPVILSVRSMEGPWGTGAKQAVELIFTERVCALIGSGDGRNAHLVEQAATKSHFPFISAWSSDPTLSHAFVPWFFNLVPNDIQQASSIIQDIWTRGKFRNVIVMSDSSYDSNMAVKNFIREAKGRKYGIVYYGPGEKKLEKAISDLRKSGPDCIVLTGQANSASAFLKMMKAEKTAASMYGSLYILNNDQISKSEINLFNDLLFSSAADFSGEAGKRFVSEYEKAYGETPGLPAAFSFDAVNVLLECISKGGTENEMIEKHLKDISYAGATGMIRFDSLGCRLGGSGMMSIKNGIPVPLSR